MKIYKKILIILLFVPILFLLSAFILYYTNTNIIIGTESKETWDENDTLDLEDIYTFDMNDTEFKILLLTDTQIGSKNDLEVLNLIDELVVDSSPDLIITLGDNVEGLRAHYFTTKFIEHMEKLDIPWVAILGNHEDDGIADRNWYGNAYQDADNSLFQMGPNTIYGTGNFVLNIENNDEHVYSLIMMDSNGLVQYEDGRDYDVIHEDQIQWYEWMIQQLDIAYETEIKSMLFFHIPIPEYKDARNEFLNYTSTNTASDSNIFGETNEEVFSPPVNSGLFDSILQYQSTTHIFAGHDHINNFSYPFKGVQFTYVQKTGYNSYNDKALNGGTLLTITVEGITVEHIYK